MGKRCRYPILPVILSGFGGGHPFFGFLDGVVDSGVPGGSGCGCGRKKDEGGAQKEIQQGQKMVPLHLR
jgi:hypothetical protein